MLNKVFLRIEILYAASENNSHETENNWISEAGEFILSSAQWYYDQDFHVFFKSV